MHDAWLGRESKVLFICSCGTICCTQDTLPVERRLWGIWNLQVWPIINSPEDEATCAALTWQSWMLRTSLQHGRVKRVSSWQPSIVHTRTGSYLWRSWHELLSLCTHVELCVHFLYALSLLGVWSSHAAADTKSGGIPSKQNSWGIEGPAAGLTKDNDNTLGLSMTSEK